MQNFIRFLGNFISHCIYLVFMYVLVLKIPNEMLAFKVCLITFFVFLYLYFYKYKRTESFKSDQFQATLDAIPGFVSWIDTDLNYLGVNSKLANFFGVSEKEFIGKKLGSIADGKNDFLIIKAKELFASKNSMIQCEICFNKEESTYWSLLTLQKYNNDKNAILISIDITKLKEVQESIKIEEAKIMHNERLVALGEMATTIAHEINNPLTLISGTTSLLEKKIERNLIETDFLLNVVSKNTHALKKIKEIIKGIQNLARDGSNDSKKPASLFGILDDVLIFESKKCQDHNVELIVNKPVEDIIFNGVPVQVGQILIVLINNAIDAIEEQSQKWVRIDVKNNEKDFQLIITDAGNGISEKIRDKIFNSFYTTKKAGKGTGIGLHIAKKIMDFHNGSIIVNPESDNTQFILTFNKSAS